MHGHMNVKEANKIYMFVKRPIAIHSFGGLGEVAFPPQKFALSNVRFTDSSLRCLGGLQWHNFHTNNHETLRWFRNIFWIQRDSMVI
jgi:hypothetical protein